MPHQVVVVIGIDPQLEVEPLRRSGSTAPAPPPTAGFESSLAKKEKSYQAHLLRVAISVPCVFHSFSVSVGSIWPRARAQRAVGNGSFLAQVVR